MPDNTGEYLLRVQNLRATYTSKRGLLKAVDGVSFNIRKGESVGIFGESGSGKSSIAVSILGIFEQMARYGSHAGDVETKRLWALKDKARKEGKTSEEMGVDLPGVEGEVWFKGENLFAMKEKDFRKIRGADITYIPQSTTKSLNPYTAIGLQTAEALWAHDDDDILYEREVLRRVLQALDLVELGDVDIRQAMKPRDFSMGEDQRILIAMALIMNPVLLVADEPTTALDVGLQGRIMDAIHLVKEKLKLTLLVISNDQGLMADIADRVGVMSAGKFMEFGDVETILKRPAHPFTRAFIMSNPPMETIRKIREKGMKIRGIPGTPPDMVNPPSGCPYHPRCEYAQEICKTDLPEYREVEPGHWVLCHRYGELPEFEL
ncbi:MAG: ABC transporter ATP-binding protein [Candidatus Thorarchaeota archaeon]